jgi:hypothetical protein
MEPTSFKALLFVQDNCTPCHRTLSALDDAFEKSTYIQVTPYKDDQGRKTKPAEDLQIDATPTVVVVRPSGSELGRFKGSSNMPPVFFSKLARFLNNANDEQARTDTP